MSLPLPAAPDLARTTAAFAHWRRTTPLGARIPEELWSQAVALAARHGVAKVAATLHLDYTRLKRRVTALSVPPPAPTVAPPAFVEMMLGLPPVGPGCVLTLSDVGGRSLRIEWSGAATDAVATVARRLWEAAPCSP